MTPEQQPSLARRSLASAGSRVGANALATTLAFGRAVALARALPVETFGVYALAGSLVTWSAYLGTLGMSAALLHRAPETTDEDAAAAVHFTLVAALSCAWAALVVAAALAGASGPLRLALVVLALATLVANLAETPRALLVRRVEHGRLAALQVAGTLASIAVALPLAWRGGGILALLAVDVTVALVTVALLYGWRPVWRPRLARPAGSVRYFFRFGVTTTIGDLLAVSLVRLDKVWTGLALGRTELGFYSRAFVFAGYPQGMFFAPLAAVAGGGYAELAGDRARLSRAFLTANAALLRAAAAAAGLLALAAPELIVIVLGERWLPMLTAFRLLLVGTLLEPLRASLASLFVAVGRPGVVAAVGTVQLVTLAAGLAAATGRLGIAGVAAALDVTLAVGVVLLLLRARAHVEVPLGRLAGAPVLALLLGLACGHVAALAVGAGAPLAAAAIKIGAFTVAYAGVLLALERPFLAELLALARGRGGR